MNYDLRDQILFGEDYNEKLYPGGVRRFNQIDIDQAKELVSLGFLDPNSGQNLSPIAEKFIEIMEKYPQLYAHGYAVSKERNDVRITIEGLFSSQYIDEPLKSELKHILKHADELYFANECKQESVVDFYDGMGYKFWSWYD